MNPKTKWTAGRWQIKQSRRDYFDIVSAETGEHIARVISTCRPECEDADAQLIALSPEWPEVLATLSAVIESHIDNPEHPWIPGANFKDGQIKAAIEAARALLAKLPK